MNYKYLDGMRGIGAMIVYLNHFMAQFFPNNISKGEQEKGYE